MNFIQSFFIAVASFFGFDQLVPVESIEPVAMIEEVDISATTKDRLDTPLPGDNTTIATTSTPDQAAAADQKNENTRQMVETDVSTVSKEVAIAEPRITTALVAGGCFWCVEADLEKTPGVISAVSGYAGGTTNDPTYDNYGSGGHREVVEVTYDATQISFEEILIVTMKTTDPTDDDGTFADRGDKYSAAFYYETPVQQKIITDLIAEVNASGPYDSPLAIDVEVRPEFYKAEDFHQDYYKGALSALKYKFYRNASGRDDFISRYWEAPRSPTLPWRIQGNTTLSNEVTADANASQINNNMDWKKYEKPPLAVLKDQMDALAFKVTQEDGTERAGSSPLDKVYEPGIYVDILSGEPLFSSKDKYDSKTGWPSFTQPIEPGAVTEHEDRKLFSVRTEIRSAIADNHIGHVFNDGPPDDGGLRYCMNGVALRFVPQAEMEAAGYGAYLDKV